MRVHPPLNSDLKIYNSNSIAEQFSFKEFMKVMRGCIKGLLEIQYECTL